MGESGTRNKVNNVIIIIRLNCIQSWRTHFNITSSLTSSLPFFWALKVFISFFLVWFHFFGYGSLLLHTHHQCRRWLQKKMYMKKILCYMLETLQFILKFIFWSSNEEVVSNLRYPRSITIKSINFHFWNYFISY